jgi:hypothetical protein
MEGTTTTTTTITTTTHSKNITCSLLGRQHSDCGASAGATTRFTRHICFQVRFEKLENVLLVSSCPSVCPQVTAPELRNRF